MSASLPVLLDFSIQIGRSAVQLSRPAFFSAWGTNAEYDSMLIFRISQKTTFHLQAALRCLISL